MAEDCEEDEVIGSRLSEVCVEFDRGVVEDLKEEYPEVFSDSPGKTKVESRLERLSPGCLTLIECLIS